MLTDPERGAYVLPNHTYIFAAPTHAQAKAIFWQQLKKDTKLLQKKVRNSTPPTITLVNDSQLVVIGLDKPARIEGITYPPIKGLLVTEFPNTKPEMWGEHVRPILSDNDGFAILNGVPEGLNHWHDKCLYAAGGKIPDIIPEKGAYAENGQWSYHSWHSADVLPAEEIEEAKQTLDERTFKQEYEASFETVEGLAYYSYSEKNIKENKRKVDIDLAIGMDFNVNPMCAVIGNIYRGAFHQFAEQVMVNSNTYEMAEKLIDRFNLKPGKDGYLPAVIYPDATGKSRASNATYSDLDILRKKGFKVYAHDQNPLQKDRINAMNSSLSPADSSPRYYIDSSCEHTLNDLAKVNRLKDGRLDKSQERAGKSRVHITDAAGYLISYNYPVRKERKWKMQKA